MKLGRFLSQDLGYFFSTALWEMDPDSYRGFRRHAVKYLQIFALMIRDFWADQCLIRASALSFTTILSLVPFFALTFAVLKGLGVQNKLEPFILEQVTAGSEELVDRIITYIDHTNMTSLGAVGLVTLIITVITLLSNIEEAFNIIWGVRETRSLYRKFSDYLSVLVSAPILMLAAVSLTTSLQSQSFVQWIITHTYFGGVILFGIKLMQHLTVWAALVFLFIFIPNTKVRLKSAVVGGVLAGTLWLAVQWGYIHFQVGVARYNAIYGTMAILPIFLIWIYTSWLIVLLGVEMVCAHQNIRTFRHELRISINYSLKELFTLAILEAVAEEFASGRPPLSVEVLAERLDIPVRICREHLELLEESGYLVQTAAESPSFQPARELEKISIKEVLDALKHYGGDFKIAKMSRGEEKLKEILARADAGASDALGGMTLKELVGISAPAAPDPGRPGKTGPDMALTKESD